SVPATVVRGRLRAALAPACPAHASAAPPCTAPLWCPHDSAASTPSAHHKPACRDLPTPARSPSSTIRHAPHEPTGPARVSSPPNTSRAHTELISPSFG